jgi:hypothetical protein
LLQVLSPAGIMSVIARQARVATLLSDVVHIRTAVVFARRGGHVFLFASSMTTDYRQLNIDNGGG